MRKFNFFITLMLVLLGCSLQAQEICNNGVDDDGDGQIDLNDSDCTCLSLFPTSLIPNPSFEEMECCPMRNDEFECATSWIQASAPTTDYVHTCEGYLGNTNMTPAAIAPLPFPDGFGAIGFRDGQANVGPGYKEYAGACLTDVMKVGRTYRLDFYVGFRDNIPGSLDFTVAIFGATDCGAIPYGGTDETIGCPLNAGGFDLLGEKQVEGSNEWIHVTIDFVADRPYSTVVIGPGCANNPNFQKNPYFYMDKLTLAESQEFGLAFPTASGSICTDNLLLELEGEPQNSYQWYLDGIAILGETNSSIFLTTQDEPGTYVLVVTGQDDCLQSEEFEVRIPPYYTTFEQTICGGESYDFQGDELTSPGTYQETITAVDGCDSIITVFLNVVETSTYTVVDTFCFGESYVFHGFTTDHGGIFEEKLQNYAGCDSIVTLRLHQLDMGFGLGLPDQLLINLGDELILQPSFLDPRFSSYRWSDTSGFALAFDYSLPPFFPTEPAVYYFQAYDKEGCSIQDSIELLIEKNYSIYIPNIFTPDDPQMNNYFRFYPKQSVNRIEYFSIYDRWGTLIFEERDVDFGGFYIGWDGRVKGRKADPGVYVYVLKALYLDGEVRFFSGNVTLLR